LVWVSVTAFLTAWFLAFFRFFLPRTLFEPATSFKIGYPEDYGLGVDTKWQQKYRIWVDRRPDRIFVIYARCTHLGCTPDWKPARTSSSVRATAAATTAKESTSRVRRRAPWTAPS
jgi:cytochrome b6-f complex iron-sulfur subunit